MMDCKTRSGHRLKLFKPEGRKIEYNWPEDSETGAHILEVIRCTREECPKLFYLLKESVINRYDVYKYESLKLLVAFYNRTIRLYEQMRLLECHKAEWYELMYNGEKPPTYSHEQFEIFYQKFYKQVSKEFA